jgi:peptide-methionine (R)-S-oxide reductase
MTNEVSTNDTTKSDALPTDAELRERLSAEEYAVLREAATERAWSGDLFVAGTKFDSNCGWPSFYESVNPDAVKLLSDMSLGIERTEVRCARCDSHLGHVFPDGFGTPTGDRYCMNSLAMDFAPES